MDNFLLLCKDVFMRMLFVEILLFIVLSLIIAILDLKDKKKGNQ